MAIFSEKQMNKFCRDIYAIDGMNSIEEKIKSVQTILKMYEEETSKGDDIVLKKKQMTKIFKALINFRSLFTDDDSDDDVFTPVAGTTLVDYHKKRLSKHFASGV